MARGAHLLTLLSIFTLSLLARTAALGRYVTPDELNWVYRSLGLRRALLAGAWQDTIQSGHPGVITTWIGAAAAQIQLWLQPQLQTRITWLDRLQQLSTDNVEAYRHLYAFLNGGRLGVAIVVSAGLVLTYILLRRLIGMRAALLATMLLALDPFYAGLSGLLHVDGLLATFMLLALLTGLCAQQTENGRRAWVGAVVAGIFTALSILTKTPGLLLIALVPMIFLWPIVSNWRACTAAQKKRTVQQLLLWGTVAVIVCLLLLPALWAAPRQVFDTVSGLNSRLLGDAVRPTFFLGQLALDHGPIFYPVVTVLRLSPVVFAGLFLALARLRPRQTDAAHARWLLLFAIFFLIAITLAAKKFDRYALPALVACIIVGAWGIEQWTKRRRGSVARVLLTVLFVQAAFFMAAWPHPLTATNWLLGGNAVARHVLAQGWGEDAGLAARRLTATLPDASNATLYTSSLSGTAPFFPGEIRRLRTPHLTRLQSDEYLLLLSEDDRLQTATLPGDALEHITVKGMPAATVYSGLQAASLSLPTYSEAPVGSQFGPGVDVQRAGAVFLPWPEESLLGITWSAAQPATLGQGYQLQMALVDGAGETWLQRELPLLSQDDHAPRDWPAGEGQTVYYTFQMPPTLAPGPYQWQLRLFDDQGRQQAVYNSAGLFAGIQLQVAPILATPPPEQPMIQAPNAHVAKAPIAGFENLPAQVIAGDLMALDIWWQVVQPGAYTLVLEMDGMKAETPLDTQGWQAGHIVRIRPVWRLPVALEPGFQQVQLYARAADSGQSVVSPFSAGSLEVVTRDRVYTLPAGAKALNIAVGELAWLQDVSVQVQEQSLSVQVIWQARETTRQAYTTFMHLRDGEAVVGGDDRQPVPPTHSWAPGEVIVETYTLPRPASGGPFTIALGMYQSADGVRLPLYDEAGQRLDGDQFVLAVEGP